MGAASQTRDKYDDQRQNFCRGVLTHDAREKAEAEVMGDLLNIERQEAALVWRGQNEGLPVEHRSVCAPSRSCNVGLSQLRRSPHRRDRQRECRGTCDGEHRCPVS